MEIKTLLKPTLEGFTVNRIPRLAAALAFYMILSLSPLVVIAVGVADLLIDQANVQDQIVSFATDTVGSAAATTIGELLDRNERSNNGVVASIIGVFFLVFAASGVFAQLQDALNRIWGVAPPKLSLMQQLRTRLTAFLLVFGLGLLLVAVLIVQTALAAASSFVPDLVEGIRFYTVLEILILFVLLVLVCAVVFKVMTFAELTWRDALVGAVVTATLLSIGLRLVRLYLRFSSAGGAYGAAGSLLVTLLVIYYAGQIFLLGAQFTKVYSYSQYGSSPEPENTAEP